MLHLHSNNSMKMSKYNSVTGRLLYCFKGLFVWHLTHCLSRNRIPPHSKCGKCLCFCSLLFIICMCHLAIQPLSWSQLSSVPFHLHCMNMFTPAKHWYIPTNRNWTTSASRSYLHNEVDGLLKNAFKHTLNTGMFLWKPVSGTW